MKSAWLMVSTLSREKTGTQYFSCSSGSSTGIEDVEITIFEKPDQNDFICITDIVKLRTDDARAADIIKNWLRTRSTIEFLGTWEALYNPSFKVVEFDHFRKEAGLPTFTLSVSNWIEKTGAIGLVSKAG